MVPSLAPAPNRPGAPTCCGGVGPPDSVTPRPFLSLEENISYWRQLLYFNKMSFAHLETKFSPATAADAMDPFFF